MIISDIRTAESIDHVLIFFDDCLELLLVIFHLYLLDEMKKELLHFSFYPDKDVKKKRDKKEDLIK